MVSNNRKKTTMVAVLYLISEIIKISRPSTEIQQKHSNTGFDF